MHRRIVIHDLTANPTVLMVGDQSRVLTVSLYDKEMRVHVEELDEGLPTMVEARVWVLGPGALPPPLPAEWVCAVLQDYGIIWHVYAYRGGWSE